jgi:hypothetical protein
MFWAKGYPMIIYGWTTLKSTKETGQFHCPQCRSSQGYHWKKANRFFTLYFIPLIPLGSAGEYIECLSCRGSYKTEVLSYDPGGDQQTRFAAVRRMLVLTMANAGKTGPENINALCDAYSRITGDSAMDQEIRTELWQAQEAKADLATFARQQSTDLSVDGKGVVLQTAIEVLSPQHQLNEQDRRTLRQLGQGLGLATDWVESTISPNQRLIEG